jgi:hypothetical protein
VPKIASVHASETPSRRSSSTSSGHPALRPTDAAKIRAVDRSSGCGGKRSSKVSLRAPPRRSRPGTSCRDRSRRGDG